MLVLDDDVVELSEVEEEEIDVDEEEETLSLLTVVDVESVKEDMLDDKDDVDCELLLPLLLVGK